MDYEDRCVQGCFYRRADNRSKRALHLIETFTREKNDRYYEECWYSILTNKEQRSDAIKEHCVSFIGAKLHTKSFQGGKTTFVINGNRGQIPIITTLTGEKGAKLHTKSFQGGKTTFVINGNRGQIPIITTLTGEKDGRYAEECYHARLKKTRRKKDAIKEYVYDVPDALCSSKSFKEIKAKSGARLHTISSKIGMTTIVIQGTRWQIRAALQMITTFTGQKENELEKAKRHWLHWVQQAFPDLEQHAYFLPPVCITRVPKSSETIAGQNVFILRAEEAQGNDLKESVTTSSARPLPTSSNAPFVQESDIIYAKALQCVLYSLKKLSKARKEVFMCLSQFSFGSYLGELRFAPAVAHLPVSSNLSSNKPWNWRQGDFDVLLIHKDYGFVIFKVKAVSETQQGEQTDRVIKVLKEAAAQLEKEDAMLSHLVSDIAPGVRITKLIACPNLMAQQLENVISGNQQLRQNLCRCFDCKYTDDVAHMLLSSNHLFYSETPKCVKDCKIKALEQLWEDLISVRGPDTQLNFSLYRSLIARFCGPASTVTISCITEPRVSIKTLDRAVPTMGNCYTAYVTLFPEQIELLSRAPSRIFISGPPGTGKSTVLLRMGSHWLEQGRNVCVLSTWDRSLAATFRLRHLLEETLRENYKHFITKGRVIFIRKDFRKKEEVEKTLTDLEELACQGPLFVIADEAGPAFESEYYIFPDFCTNLLERCQLRGYDLHFWVSSCHDNVAPEELHNGESEGWELVPFTRSLRSPPSVVREIRSAVEITKDLTVRDYTDLPDPSHGPPVRWIYHHSRQHGCLRVEDCDVCGEEVARFIRTKLRLDVSASSMDSNSTPNNTDDCLASSKSTPRLRYKDVLILSWTQLREDAPVLKALSSYKVPVRVMKDSDIEDVATAHTDVVWAARHQLIFGLMRKIVVVLNNYDDSKGKYISTRLRAMSRCSSHLVVVYPPSEYEPD